MSAGELELYSTRALIDELVRRATFQGVIVHSPEGGRAPEWDGDRVFSVQYNANLSDEAAGRLLDRIGQHLIDLGLGA